MKAIESVKLEREAHHAALEQLAKSINPKIHLSGLELWRKLNRLERIASDASTRYCNGLIPLDEMDATCERVTLEVKVLFGGLPPRFHINRDPRGCALKLEPFDSGERATKFPLYRDMGGNQILAPTID